MPNRYGLRNRRDLNRRKPTNAIVPAASRAIVDGSGTAAAADWGPSELADALLILAPLEITESIHELKADTRTWPEMSP